jgi:[acyl-carrier-protein] S-malonyltransferase
MIAAIFPGQGSQQPGMGKELYDSSAAAKSVFDEVTDATGVNVARLCFEAEEAELRQTQNAQLALYTSGLAAYRALGVDKFQAMAGHSVGEYAALVAAGILGAGDGAKLVQRRGDLMARSGNLRPGTMSAILGLDKDKLQQVCRTASGDDGVVVIANDNCPGQLVISGDVAAVARAEELAKEAGAKRALRLNVSGAFHSPLMVEPGKAMGVALKEGDFQESSVKVYCNVLAEPPGANEWPMLLETQLSSPVRWTESVQNMVRDGVDTFVEFGAGEVLCGLVRRINRDVHTFAVKDADSLTVARELKA